MNFFKEICFERMGAFLAFLPSAILGEKQRAFKWSFSCIKHHLQEYIKNNFVKELQNYCTYKRFFHRIQKLI